LGLFFSVIHVGANPPYLGVLFRPHTVPRHTLENILATKSFTVNAVSDKILEQAHQSSAKYSDGQSEFKEVGLKEFYSASVKAPYVEESHIKVGCSFVERHDIKVNETIFIVGKIEECWLSSDYILPDGFIDQAKANTMLVNGLDTYYSAQMEKRLGYARPGEKVEEK